MKNFSDSCLNNLFRDCYKRNYRSIILITEKDSIFKIPNIHYLWKKNSFKNSSTILWCYKDKTISRKTEQKEFGDYFKNKNQIRYCYYKDTKKILGNTYGMCILQDFESITPNSLARIVETVQGGGTIIFFLDTYNKKKNLLSLSMDIYQNFKNQAYQSITSRFLDRFFLSLKSCSTFLQLDSYETDFSGSEKSFDDTKNPYSGSYLKKSKSFLTELIKNMGSLEPLSCLLSKTKTFDQARAFLTFSEAIADKKKWSTIVMTSGRGRGKSSTLGLSAAAAIAFGYGNIYVTAPSPENLNSFFAFFLLGLKALGYIEGRDFDVIQNPRYRCIDRIKVFSSHYQQIKFLYPSEIENYKNLIELLIVDEAAAIPLNFLNKIMGTYVIFISSTSGGYEGSGRTFALKLLKKIKTANKNVNSISKSNKSSIFREIFLDEPIRYSVGDPVEKWLNQLLCLDLKNFTKISRSCPNPKQCHLFLIDRNALFTFHSIASLFLQKIMSLFSSSHYKNSPDDLQMICDAPSHRIFALIPPLKFTIGLIPDILCIIHTAYEGQMNVNFVRKNIKKGSKINGDLIPWAISKQYFDPNFGELSGLRIIRIVTSPDSQKLGYGSRSLELINKFLVKKRKNPRFYRDIRKVKNIPAILNKIQSKIPPKIDYIGVAFGLDLQLLCFWNKNGFVPLYLQKKKSNFIENENAIMIKEIKKKKKTWLDIYKMEFLKRFFNQLSSSYRNISSYIIFNLIETIEKRGKHGNIYKNYKLFFSSSDLHRISFFRQNTAIDLGLILDLFPIIGKIYFWGGFDPSFFSYIEKILLIALGLQCKKIEEISNELSIKIGHLVKIVAKIFEKVDKIFNC
jgi:N-acetyltransferase 10